MAARSIFPRIRTAAWLARKAVRARRGGDPMPAILMYHRIAEDSFDPWGLAVSPANFRSQLAWLSQTRTLLPLEDFAQAHRRDCLPRNAAAVTFDDGYRCVGEIAEPLLREFAVPATIFVPVDLVCEDRPFWWDELEAVVIRHPRPTLVVNGEEFSLGEQSADDRAWEARAAPRTPRQAAFETILTRITRMNLAERKRAIDALRQDLPGIARLEKRPMAPERLRRLDRQIFSIGSHTRNHAWLPSLSEEDQVEEIVGSVGRIEAITGNRPTAFAYPYGASDATSRRIAEAAGFACACVTGNSSVPSSADAFALPRIQVGNWDAAELRHALARV